VEVWAGEGAPSEGEMAVQPRRAGWMPRAQCYMVHLFIRPAEAPRGETRGALRTFCGAGRKVKRLLARPPVFVCARVATLQHVEGGV